MPLDFKTGLWDAKLKKRVDYLLPPEVREHGIYDPSPEMKRYKKYAFRGVKRKS